MNRIHYVEIENFKVFSERLHINLGHPAVLIGPNNAGKTSVIQALSLWSRGVRAWYEKKGEANRKERRERVSAGINRLNILDVPVAENRFFWNNTRVRKGNTPIELMINVGLEVNGEVRDCRLKFTYRDSEVIYCRPCEATLQDDRLLQQAAGLQFHLLYPMSGILSSVSADTEETPLPDGRINMFLGQGQTAQVLRNICYKVAEQDEENGGNDWQEIQRLMSRLFLIDLKKPEFNESRGCLILRYTEKNMDNELDISLAGRGLQQILLILAYLYWHKRAILLVDEPDAHLEILRQRQIYTILKYIAGKNGGQVIIATHSEVILDEAVDTNLTMLLLGQAVNLAQNKDMKNALRSYGITHYANALRHPCILYVEGSTDVDILRALAKKLGHPAYDLLSNELLNTYYTCNQNPQDSMENRLERAEGAFGRPEAHFYTIKPFVKNLKGIAIFDNDKANKQDDINDDLAILYWRHYEIENYFITPDLLNAYARKRFAADSPLFATKQIETFRSAVDESLLEMVFANDRRQLDEFHSASSGLKRTILKDQKMSAFAETVFRRFAQQQKQPILLNKGEFFHLVELADPADIDPEVREKLDLMVRYLELKS